MTNSKNKTTSVAKAKAPAKLKKAVAVKSGKDMTAAEIARSLGKNVKVARAKLRSRKLAFVGKTFGKGSEVYKVIASINA